MKYCLLILSFVVLSLLPALADGKDNDWSGSTDVNVQTTPAAVSSSTPGKPVLNITQPQVERLAPATAVRPAKTQKIKTSAKTRKTRRKRSTRKRKSRKTRKKRQAKPPKITETEWWEKSGNPAVFSFRDCLSEHARRYEKLAGEASPRAHVTQAMDVSCRQEFDSMARTIAARFGEDGFRKLASELIKTTFLPAASIPE